MHSKIYFSLKLILIFSFFILSVFFVAGPVSADANSMMWGSQAGSVQTSTGLGDEDPRVMVSSVVNILLGFLGIIAVIAILIGGFKYMTAGGDSGETDKATKIIGAGVVGLVVILMAYALANFIIDKLYTATGATG